MIIAGKSGIFGAPLTAPQRLVWIRIVQHIPIDFLLAYGAT